MKVICVIPARKGSKRLPKKNKKLFCGKPLIVWTIELALQIKEIDKIIITTDDEDILLYCYDHYNDFDRIYILERMKEISHDNTPMWRVIEDLYNRKIVKKSSIVLLLQPTSPLRSKEDVKRAIRIFIENEIGIVSVYKKNQKTYIRDGNIFIDYYKNWIKYGTVDGLCFLAQKETSIDIDTLEDFQMAEKLMKKKKN